MAIIQAGLGMMAGTSPYALQNIGKGGQEGLATYLAGRKSLNDSQDALDHSQFLMAQAQEAALKGDVNTQVAMQNAAEASLMAHQQHKLAGLNLLNTSQAKKAELDILQQKNNISAAEAENTKNYRSRYLDILEQSKPDPDDKLNATVMARVNADPLIKQLADQLKPGTGTVQPGTQEYNDTIARIHKLAVPYYKQAGIDAPEMPELDTIQEELPKQGFWDRLIHGPQTPVAQPSPMSSMINKFEDQPQAGSQPLTGTQPAAGTQPKIIPFGQLPK
jgi:hypothetical protein